MKQQSGFTLVELMIVVAIMAILASIVIPSYQDYVTKGQLTEGISELADARVKMEQAFQDSHTYDVFGDGSTCPTAIPAAGTNFTYSCTLTPSTYIITATGINKLAGFSYTINQENTKATTGLKAGWGSATVGCWITSKGGTC